MQEPDEILRIFMVGRSMTQEELCANAGVSQSTVSRALKRTPGRRGRAWVRLFTYVTRELDAPAFSEGGKERILAAMGRVWDGTDSHAIALARIIDALEGLHPSGEKKEEPS